MSTFSNPKINPFHGYLLCLSATLALAQISGIIILIEDSKRDGLTSVIFGCAAYFIYAYWIYRIVINQQPNQSFLDAIQLKMGSLAAWTVRCWIALYLICELFVTHKNIVTWVKSMILPFTPIWAISLPMLILCAYFAFKGIKPIAISFSVLFPILLILMFFMAIFTFKYRHHDLLLPLFNEGTWPILSGTATCFRIGMELFWLLLLMPHIQGQFKWKHFGVLCSSTSFFFINIVVGIITTFGIYEASKQRFPLFTQWRLVSISSFVEHLDFLSMYQWLCTTAIQISLGLFLLGDLLTSSRQNKKIAILTFTAVLFIGIELKINDSIFLALTKAYFYPLSALSILCWTLLAHLTTRKRGSS